MATLVRISVFLSAFLFQKPYSFGQEAICFSKETCGQCIAAHPLCAWCSEVVNRTDPRWTRLRNLRCGTRDSLLPFCQESNIASPRSTLKKLTDLPLGGASKDQEDVQVRPQRVHIQLRPKESFVFSLEFKQARDYPVDLYYLMDLSYSMKDDKSNLEKLGNILAQAMKNVTSKFNIGFGSFVDKRALPFVSTVESLLRDPCGDKCDPPYGFQNRMSLSPNTDLFARRVNDTNISGNLDSPEGGFDAIMQVLLCQKEIGWRSKSRKLLVFATDAGYHFAGDGKLAGIVKPNDERCHLNAKGEYTESLGQDYPSVAQLRRQIRESKVNLIMAVTANVIDLYTRLSAVLEGSSAGVLDRDSKNVVQLVRAQYEAITDFVEMSDNSSEHVQISYFSACNDGRYEERKICRGLKVGSNVTFDVRIRVSSCPADSSQWTEVIQIYPVGLNESTVIELSLICECDCEKPGRKESASPMCSNGNGTFQCGVCACNSNRYGKDCECSLARTSSARDNSGCIRPNETRQCSGQGTCLCGQCICDRRENPEEIISGVYCEIENYSCNRTNGKICSGNGQCAFQKCTCNPGWSGDTCECTNATCIARNQDQVCSGHGRCMCDRCVCQEENGDIYYGAFCEKKKTKNDLCNDWNDCIVCMASQPDNSNNNGVCDSVCTPNEKTSGNPSGGELVCPFVSDKAMCNYIFSYKPNSVVPVIETECSKDNTLPIALGTIGGTVAVGLLILLLWKVMTSIHDSREYARFENEKKKAIWRCENPIYKEATAEFQNPTFSHRPRSTSSA